MIDAIDHRRGFIGLWSLHLWRCLLEAQSGQKCKLGFHQASPINHTMNRMIQEMLGPSKRSGRKAHLVLGPSVGTLQTQANLAEIVLPTTLGIAAWKQDGGGVHTM